MFNKENVMEKIISLDQLIISQEKENRNSKGLSRFHHIIETIKGVGMVQGPVLGQDDGRYFLIDGTSWQRACMELESTITPNFIMWEETDFFTFLESLLKETEK